MELYGRFFECCTSRMFEAVERIAEMQEEKILVNLEVFLIGMMERAGYVKEVCHYVSLNPQQPSFVLSNITLPDFKFF